MEQSKYISFGGRDYFEHQTLFGPEVVFNNGVIFLSKSPDDWSSQLFPTNARYPGYPAPLLGDVSTDQITRVADILTDDLGLIGDRALCGLPIEFQMKEGTLSEAEATVLVAGKRFGSGSSREQAVWALLMSNISAVIADSFGPIFEKNAAFIGLFTSTDKGLAQKIQQGDPIPLEEFTRGKDTLMQNIINAGGLFPYLDGIKSGKYNEPVTTKKENLGGGMNILEKRLARALKIPLIHQDDAALLPVDLAYSYVVLSGLARETLITQYGEIRSALSPEKIYLFEDHFAHSVRPQVVALTENQRRFAQELNLPAQNYYKGKREEKGGAGICHRVMLEKIDPRYTQIVIATDSHTPTICALPIVGIPVGSTLFAAGIGEERIPFSVPPVMRIEFTGNLPKGFSIRDVQLELASKVTPAKHGMTIEYGGKGLDTLSFDQVAALCNMVPEIFNAEMAVTEAFQEGIDYLHEQFGITEDQARELYGKPDSSCRYEQVITYDLSLVSPWIALPGSPHNTIPLSMMKESVKLDKAYLVSCTLGLSDLKEAAATIKDGKISPDTRLIVVPSSKMVADQAEKGGILSILRESGAEIVNESACGPCIGEGLGSLQDDETAISASNRNFPGRMGSKKGNVYLGGSILTAMSAILGRIPTAEEYKSYIERIVSNLELFN